MTDKFFLVLDLETTGLDPDTDKILEVAWMILDENLHETYLEAKSYTVDWGHQWVDVYNLLRSNDYVRNMHQESGLLQDVQEGFGESLFRISNHLFDDIECLPRDSTVHLTGLSVHFDKSFLLKVPHFADLFVEGGDLALHHRMLDLSAVKLMYGAAGIDVPKVTNINAHRALNDVLEVRDFAQMIRNDLRDRFGVSA